VKKFLILALAFALLAVALPATAQDGTVSMLIRIEPKAGMTDQWEEGVKKHMEFHGQQGDTWSWAMWEVISGDKTGEFTVGTYGHEWSDFDNMPVSGPEDEADGKKTTEAYTESVSIMYSNYMPEFSLPPDGDGPSKLLSIFTVYVKPEFEEDYVNAIRKIPEALKKANSSIRYFFADVVIGGRQPAYRIVIPADSFADLAPPATPFRRMLEEAYGASEADAILDTISRASYGSNSELLIHRPDLSYTPSSTSN